MDPVEITAGRLHLRPRSPGADPGLAWAVCDSTTGQELAHVTLRPGGAEGVWVGSCACLPAAPAAGVVAQAQDVVSRWASAELGAARLEWTVPTLR